MKKNILLISYYWPPTGGAGVIRWLMFTKYLSKEKYNIIVYTPENPEAQSIDKSFLNHISPEIKILKKKIWEPYQLFKKATGKKENFNAGFLNEEKTKAPGFLTKFSMYIRANFFIPDARMLWIRPSAKSLSKVVVEENIDLVISTGPPHSLHLIAKKLKKKHSIKWLADFRDPWTNIDFIKDLPMSKWALKIQQKLEISVLKQADRITIVSDQWRKDLQAIFSRPMDLLPNGYEVSFPENIKHNEKFSILHVGNINADRSHESFFRAIHHLLEESSEIKTRLVIQFIGKVDLKAREFIKKYELNEYVEFIKYMPHKEVGKYLKKAHILYLPINRTQNANGILTGKFYEYLAAKRPVLAQGLLHSDMDRVIKETNSGHLFDFDDHNSAANILLKYFKKYQNGEAFELSNDVEKYSRKSLTRDLETIIDQELNQ